jgi:hypothetical protein
MVVEFLFGNDELAGGFGIADAEQSQSVLPFLQSSNVESSLAVGG